MKRSVLYIFNLATDSKHPSLAFTIDWISEFSKSFDRVKVFSTKVGTYKFQDNVEIRELGGGSSKKRFIALMRLFKTFLNVFSERENAVVFHHQSPRTSLFPGLLFRLIGVPQILWYSHSAIPISLKFGARIVNGVVSSEPNSISLKSNRIQYIGHGISPLRFNREIRESRIENEILYVGRIDPIKHLEEIINSVALSGEMLAVRLVGPTSYSNYGNKLKVLAARLNIPLEIQSFIEYSQVPNLFSRYSFVYSGMRNSVDKTSLEATMSGCLVITTDEGTLQLSGMREAWLQFHNQIPNDLSSQIRVLKSLNPEIRKKMSQVARDVNLNQNSLEVTVGRISRKFSEY